MLFKYRGAMIVQYWETNEKLLSYAKMPVQDKQPSDLSFDNSESIGGIAKSTGNQ
jgi:hypothetical protein